MSISLFSHTKKREKHHNKKVFVGMSGGVDSSLSAALLKEAGYDVTGVFIEVWQPDFVLCSAKEDRRDAMRVASQLDISFVTLDLKDVYKKGVIDYMLSEYEKGYTPNPDVMCNREVKFGAFWKWAEEQGADCIATGHYAQVISKNNPDYFVSGPQSSSQCTDEYTSKMTFSEHCTQNNFSKLQTQYMLGVSEDTQKDQSYFLWTLTSADLEHVLFPIGHMKKDDVRKESHKRNLFTSNKKDSQGLCFVGTIDIKEFLIKELGERKGDVLDEKEKVIGIHRGAIFYTLGERHGFTIINTSDTTTAHYIVARDIAANTLTVSKNKPENSEKREIIIRNISLAYDSMTEEKLYARSRYRAPLIEITFQKNKDDTVTIFPKDEGLVASSGQSLVIYQGDICLGGGVIV